MMLVSRPTTAAMTLAAALLLPFHPSAQNGDPQPAPQQKPQPPQQPLLTPTLHAAVPQSVEDFWLVPSKAERTKLEKGPLAAAASAYADGHFAAALTAARRASAQGGALADYASYYQGLAELRLSHAPEAVRVLSALVDRQPDGNLAVSSRLALGEAAELSNDGRTAADIYDKLSARKTVAPDDVLLRLGRAALAAGDTKRAAEAFLRVYYEFPLSDSATSAAAALAPLQEQIVKNGYKLDLGRASVLFGARRYSDARDAFADLRPQVTGDERELVDLRLAESDYFLKRYAAARDALEPYLDKSSRRAEARFFYLGAIGELGDRDRYIALTHALVSDFPDSTWSEEALNNLGTYYILSNQDQLAADTFKELYDKFPAGTRAERAAWKYGWWSYKTANYAETVRVFESAAANFPRSDYRPPYLYWAARARAQMGDRATATARLRLVYTDYMNSYYGRLAARRLATTSSQRTISGDAVVPAAARRLQAPAVEPPANAPVIRKLLAAGLYDDALDELRYAQKTSGNSPLIDATMAWAYHQKGELRRAITLMRRAYPQHLAAGGEDLPPEILQVIYPLTYWNWIKRYSDAHDLDPYIVAALIAQESTFDADVRSAANAWGLMQIVPATGRRLARSLGVRRFTTSMLTRPELNIRMGTLYFSRLVEQFGGTYYALASYNAGESRVVRWKAERPGLDEDEFIDDIPFPETQNYVKRILGTAEDYRRLYGESGAEPSRAVRRPASTATVAPKAPAKSTAKKPSTAKKKTTTKPTAKKPAAKKPAPKKRTGGGTNR
jgi:soluble lytic murein transglycosylase